MKKGLLLIMLITLFCSISIVFAALDSNKSVIYKAKEVQVRVNTQTKLENAVSNIMFKTQNLRKYTVARSDI